MVKWLAITLLAMVILWTLHRVALWMENRGWIYYQKRKASGSGVGNALLEIHRLIEPSKVELLKARTEEHYQDEESGNPPDPPEATDSKEL